MLSLFVGERRIVNRTTVMLPDFRKSYVSRVATKTANAAVLFVHGYGGSPSATWQSFPLLLEDRDSNLWGSVDAFFYSYESWRTPIVANAQKLKSFVDTHILSVADYKSLICVGHSEGAVLIRKMVLQRVKQFRVDGNNALSTDLISNSRLRLFAPACLGTNFSSFLGFILTWSAFVSAIAASSLTRNELRSESPVLLNLREETKREVEMSPFIGLTARNVFGVRDQVVYADGYPNDEVIFWEGHDHFSLCKPRLAFIEPLRFVEQP